MTNGKLLLSIIAMVLPLKLCCMNTQQPPVQCDRTRTAQYSGLNRTIRWTEGTLRNLKYRRGEFNANDVIGSLVIASCFIASIGSYKLLGKIWPASICSPGKTLFGKLLIPMAVGLPAGYAGSLGVFLLSNYTNLFGISHAIAHRLYPGIKTTTNHLNELYNQETELRPATIENHTQDDQTYIQHLQAQQHQLKDGIRELRQNQAQAIRQAHEPTEQLENQLRQAKAECVQLFEDYINRIFPSFRAENEVGYDSDALLNGLVNYVDQRLIMVCEPRFGVSVHITVPWSDEIICHTLQLVVHARNNGHQIHEPENFSRTLRMILLYAIHERHELCGLWLNRYGIQLSIINNADAINRLNLCNRLLRNLAGQQPCSQCHTVFNNRQIPTGNHNCRPIGTDVGQVFRCGHIICHQCWEQSLTGQGIPGDRFNCPVCVHPPIDE